MSVGGWGGSEVPLFLLMLFYRFYHFFVVFVEFLVSVILVVSTCLVFSHWCRYDIEGKGASTFASSALSQYCGSLPYSQVPHIRGVPLV